MKTKSNLLAVGVVAAPLALVNGQYIVGQPAANASNPFEGFVSYSIEFASFPDFAGNKTHPNTYSNTLLENLGNIIGTKPYIRVGGNTQDYALYNASQPEALVGIVNTSRSFDYPTTVTIGPAYFESYGTWNATKFSHGFNMALGGSTAAGWQTLLDTVLLACKALGPEKLYWWEYGNEADLFSTSAQGPTRPKGWNETTFVKQYLNGTRTIQRLLAQHCPGMASGKGYGFLGPSFAGVGNTLKAPAAWQDGLNADGETRLFSAHNYISGATSPGVTLQGTLMNHTVTMSSVNNHVVEYAKIKAIDPSAPPHIFGETNSLYNEGKPGLSNSFGAALWGVDFNLYSASVGIQRVHMHMGTNFRYQSWQPISTNITTIGTKAPYYGNIAVASMLGDLTAHPVSIVAIPLAGAHEAAYAAYYTATNALARILVLNLNTYNTTVDGAGLVPLPAADVLARPSTEYAFSIPHADVRKAQMVGVRRLWANGSDAITGITWDGWSYNHELDGGRPVRLGNVTVGETVAVDGNGTVRVSVPDSSLVILDF